MIRPPFLAWLVDTLDFPFPCFDAFRARPYDHTRDGA